MTASTDDVLSTLTEKVAVPPGSGNETGSAALLTTIEPGTFVTVTTASSLADALCPSSSRTEAVTTSLWELPAPPLTFAVKEQLYSSAPPGGTVARG